MRDVRKGQFAVLSRFVRHTRERDRQSCGVWSGSLFGERCDLFVGRVGSRGGKDECIVKKKTKFLCG